MSKQVPWTRDVMLNFERMALLNDMQCYLLESRCKGVTITEQALHLNVSESTVHRQINLLKKKYDIVQKEHPEMFPVRKSSAAETYMDTH